MTDTTIKFRLFDTDGVGVEFTLTNLDQYATLKATLLGQGFSVVMPDKAATAHKTDTVVGYMWGWYKDRRNDDAPQFCCHLYTQRGKYKTYTVYPECFDKLPASVLAHKPKRPKDGVQVPPPTDDALGDEAFHRWSATINTKPRLTTDGAVYKNDNGFPVYLFDSVVGQTPAPTNGNGKANPTAADDNPFYDSAPQPDVDFYPNQPAAKATDPKRATLNTLHALGKCYFGEQWESARRLTVEKAGQARTPPVALTSSNELTLAELDHWIKHLEKGMRSAITGIAESTLDDPGDLTAMVARVDPKSRGDLAQCYGVALTKVMQELDKAAVPA